MEIKQKRTIYKVILQLKLNKKLFVFFRDELPKLRYNPTENDQKQFLPGEEQIAYPGLSNLLRTKLFKIINDTIAIFNLILQ